MDHAKNCCSPGFANIDLERKSRRGHSEAVYSPGKSKEQLKKITLRLIKNKQEVLLTRLDKDKYDHLKRSVRKLKYHSLARIGYIPSAARTRKKGHAAVVSAGTSDIPVAEEAAVTLELMGNRVTRLYDVGVAGVHRLMNNISLLRQAKVIIVVAGMEGALASVISGLVSSPVIAVPTSCGYGASFEGLAALLAMLNCCSAGVTVVNIDNGFGAGYFASLINK
ncbi:MAG: nickel pincer cofactor biosynthesis protein LarB [Candidatus Omnitrophica bacterium]|nr:nickel pincer cofactor biosynthesis protein LarB [Candidatus Omnitrophota bacterium]MDD5553146.1 nickel pincer cofactor biosynthesis protein LarB [Candidatus Omnitrophota bacterium]